MDPAIMQVVTIFVGEMIFLPIMMFLLKRMLGKRLDDFDEKRENARRETKAREVYREAWEASISNGIKSLLRSEIIREFHKSKERGYASLEAKEYTERTFEVYSELGGNGLGKAMYEAIMKMPTEPPEEDHTSE